MVLFTTGLVFSLMVLIVSFILAFKTYQRKRKNRKIIPIDYRDNKRKNENRLLIISVLGLFFSVFVMILTLLFAVPTPIIYPLDNEARVYNGTAKVIIKTYPFLTTYYTLDGSDPEFGYVYEDTFTIAKTTTVSAKNKFLIFWSGLSQNTYVFNDMKDFDDDSSSRYYRGSITRTGWESKFIGLRYTNPEGMVMSTKEELDEMNEFEDGTPPIVFTEDELGQARLTTVIEMQSMSDDKSILVGVCVERMIDDIVDVSQFIKEFEELIYQNPFYNYTLISDDETVKIGNDDYVMVSYMVDFNNVYRYQDSYFRVVGDRAIMISLNYNDEEARDNVLDAFTAY